MLKARYFIFLALLFSNFTFAQYYVGPAASGTGNAGRAVLEGSESSLMNPATLAFLRDYDASVHYSEGSHPENGYQKTYGILLSDSSAGQIVPGSISFFKKRIVSGGVEASEQNITLALGEHATPYLSMGILGHYRSHERERNAGNFYQTNADLGALLTPSESLGIAFVAYNVLPTNDKVPQGVRDVPTIAVGANLVYESFFRIRADIVRPDKFNPGHRMDVETGAETEFMSNFLFRIGFDWAETKDEHWATAGLGYRGPKLSFNYAYQIDTRVAGGYRHVVDLWMPF